MEVITIDSQAFRELMVYILIEKCAGIPVEK
jgi:hypothetical protein